VHAAYEKALISALKKHYFKSPRLELFGQLTGVVGDHYDSHLCDLYLAVLKALFPKFNAAVFRSRK
jgi:hypothetical protein